MLPLDRRIKDVAEEAGLSEQTLPNRVTKAQEGTLGCGNPMKGTTLLALFFSLGISNSYSRLRVSNDNPCIESWFKTLKYDVSYPGSFSSIEEAREWYAAFVNNYNTAHAHSGLQHVTSQQMRDGEHMSLIRNRNKVMMEVKLRNQIR